MIHTGNDSTLDIICLVYFDPIFTNSIMHIIEVTSSIAQALQEFCLDSPMFIAISLTLFQYGLDLTHISMNL
jgi:hypothetical protein